MDTVGWVSYKLGEYDYVVAVLAEVVEGNRGMVTPSVPEGNSAAAVNGCWQCHGSQIKVLSGGKLDPARCNVNAKVLP